MRPIDKKRSAPALQDLFDGVERLIGIDVETVGFLNGLGQEIGANEAYAFLEL